MGYIRGHEGCSIGGKMRRLGCKAANISAILTCGKRVPFAPFGVLPHPGQRIVAMHVGYLEGVQQGSHMLHAAVTQQQAPHRCLSPKWSQLACMAEPSQQ